MTVLTAADYADTGQWRLIVKIFPDGMTAHLENTLHDDVEPQELFTSSWEKGDGTLLQNIENAVYDHPRVLDDFAARIVVYDMHTLMMPTELVAESVGQEEQWYTAVYPCDEADIMYDTDGDLLAAYMPVKGLKGFLNRTFPGARVTNHLMEEVRDMRRRAKEGLKGRAMGLHVRGNEADFVLTDGEKLLSASTHPLTGPTDAAYHAFNIMAAYGVNPSETAVILKGDGLPDEVAEVFAKFTKQ